MKNLQKFLKHKINFVKLERSGFFWTVILIIVGFVLLYPLINLFINSLDSDAYIYILKNQGTWIALLNTLKIAFSVMVLTLILGGSLAYLVTHTDFKYKKFVNRMVFLTFAIPSYVLGISWLELFGRNGFVDKFGIIHRPKAYSIFAVILVLSIHLFPMVYFALKNILLRTDNTLEDMAVISGSSRIKAIFHITIPLMLPGIFAIGLFVFSKSMANFGVPALLLMPLYKETLTTRIYRSLNNLRLDYASVLSLILLIISAVIYKIHSVFMARKQFITINNNTVKPKLIPVRDKKVLTVIVIGGLIIISVVPLVVLVISSFLKQWGLDIRWENFTFGNYIRLFRTPLVKRAVLNSIFYGLGAFFIAGILACTISYLKVYKKGNLAILLGMLANWPMVFPNIVMALGAIVSWRYIYGTGFIIVITYAALFLPICLKHIEGIGDSYDPDMFKMSLICGASPFRGYIDIILPILKPGLLSSMILCILIAFREIPIALMLHVNGTETMGVLLYNMKSNSCGMESTSAVSVLVIIISFIGRIVIGRLKND